MTTFNELLAQRAALLSELADIEKALAVFKAAEPVQIETRRNLRNSSYVTVRPDRWPDAAAVYADRALTIIADESDHGGWISHESAAWLESIHAFDETIWKRG